MSLSVNLRAGFLQGKRLYVQKVDQCIPDFPVQSSLTGNQSLCWTQELMRNQCGNWASRWLTSPDRRSTFDFCCSILVFFLFFFCKTLIKNKGHKRFIRVTFPSDPWGTHVVQGGTPPPWGSQGWVSSSGGHGASSPTENWSTCLLRVRLPLGDSRSTQVFEQELHSAHSVTRQSFGRMQDWMIRGWSLGPHRLWEGGTKAS